MKLLVLGQSDTAGDGLPDTTRAWPREVERLMREQGTGCEMVHRRFYVHLPRVLEFLEGQLDANAPDCVLLPLTSYSFALPMVSISVRRRFGARAQRAYLRLEEKFDRATRKEEGWRRRANRAGRAVSGAVLGRASYTTLGTAVQLYGDAVERLARREGVRVVVMGASHHGPSFQKRERGAVPEIVAFNERMREATLQRRMEWIDYEAVLERSGDRDRCWSLDGVHKSEFGHAHVGREVAAILMQPPVRPGSS